MCTVWEAAADPDAANMPGAVGTCKAGCFNAVRSRWHCRDCLHVRLGDSPAHEAAALGQAKLCLSVTLCGVLFSPERFLTSYSSDSSACLAG